MLRLYLSNVSVSIFRVFIYLGFRYLIKIKQIIELDSVQMALMYLFECKIDYIFILAEKENVKK